MDFHNFLTVHVFKVSESIADILSELRCSSDLDLKNQSQLPVWEILVILSHTFLRFSHFSCFRGQGIHCWYFYIATNAYHVQVTSKIQVVFRFNRYLEVLVTAFCRFLIFLHFLCLWGQGIIWWHSSWATIFGIPQKFRSPPGSGGFWGYSNICSFTKML